jgi:hypothetical protein
MKYTTQMLIASIATDPLIAAEKNPHIDYETFARQAGKYRKANRLAEADLIAAMAEPVMIYQEFPFMVDVHGQEKPTSFKPR